MSNGNKIMEWLNKWRIIAAFYSLGYDAERYANFVKNILEHNHDDWPHRYGRQVTSN